MPDRPSPNTFLATDEEVVRYRALSTSALAALLAGLFSPLTMVFPAFWFVPLAAVVLAGLSLWRIEVRNPDLIGRPAALVGLFLGTVFLVAAPADDFLYHYFIRQEARQFAQTWIDAVRKGEVYKAHQLMVQPTRRLPLESKLNSHYRIETNQRMLKTFVNEPTMRTLFAIFRSTELEPAAQIRFYETASTGRQQGFDTVEQIYAVTYPDERKQPTTFFLALLLQRSIEVASGRAQWTVLKADGGVRPPGW